MSQDSATPPAQQPPAPRLSVQGIRKAFGPTVALAGVTLSAPGGSVHAIVGENGAGKSTLMHILSGALQPDAGSMLVDGEPYRPRNPEAARRAGVAMVHQELSLCPHLSVAENILLGIEPTHFGWLSRREMEAQALAALAAVAGPGRSAGYRGVNAPAPLSPGTRAGDLPLAAQQLVEIARAISQSRCRLLILDEPTSSLSAADVEQLFRVLVSLRAQGLTILYISHVLEEVQRIADSYTVLRDGHAAGGGPMKGAELSEIVRSMAGRQIEQMFPRSAHTPGEVILEIDDLAGRDKPVSASLSLRRGEVLGLAGLVGAGRTELLRAVFGLDPIRSGRVRAGAFAGPASPARRLAQGMGLLSEDRAGEGLATRMSIADNVTLGKLAGFGPPGIVLPGKQRKAAERWISHLSVRCRDPAQRVSDLSGGNQQKVALARLLHQDVDIFLLDEPTRGIDVASKAQIYALIDALALAGKAVLMASSYLPELLGTCDRIAVMCRGRLGPARPARELSEHDLLLEATGA